MRSRSGVALGHQVLVPPVGQQRPGVRVHRVGGGRGVAPHQGDLAEIADPRGEGFADQVEQPEVHQGRAVGVGGVLADRQVGLVAE